MHVSFCPFGDVCKKGGARLGKDVSSERARQRIATHLMNSPYHNLNQDDAEIAAGAADIMEEAHSHGDDDSGAGAAEPPAAAGNRWTDAEWHEWNAQRERSKGKGKGTKSWTSRSTPYPEVDPPSLVLERAPRPATVDLARIATAISRAEAGARAASRMARQAFQAFEDEANVLREALDQLRTVRG